MSLNCGEHQGTVASHFILTIDDLFVVTTAEAAMFTAVCRTTLDTIPESERYKDPIIGGLDIHWGFSIPNALPGRENNLSLRYLRLGDYRYSIRAETAAKYLPSMAVMYCPRTP